VAQPQALQQSFDGLEQLFPSLQRAMAQAAVQVTAQEKFFRIRCKTSTELHKSGKWYIGLLEHLPPPTPIEQEWNKIFSKLENHLRRTTAQLDQRIPIDKTITDPVLCMAGKRCTSTSALQFLDPGAVCPTNPVLLKPTVWIYCGGHRCKRRVENEINAQVPYLRWFLESCHMQEEQLRIALDAPRPAGETSSPHSSGPTVRVDNISFAVQHPLSADNIWPAKARFTVNSPNGRTEIYSTIGGAICVDNRMFGLTTAHAIVSYLDQTTDEAESSDEESSVSDCDSKITSSSAFEGSNEGPYTSQANACSEPSPSDTEADEQAQSEWEKLDPPKVLAYVGRGTSTGDYSFPDLAPSTSDFALVDLQTYRNQIQPIASTILPRDALSAGEVRIITTAANPSLRGYLLNGECSLVMRGAVMQTMKIQIESPAGA
jgi:hypothetical protein